MDDGDDAEIGGIGGGNFDVADEMRRVDRNKEAEREKREGDIPDYEISTPTVILYAVIFLVAFLLLLSVWI